MKNIIAALTLLIITFSYSSNLHAKNYKMVFWYPGEQGSTTEAQPILDTFFEYIKDGFERLNTSKKVGFSGKFFNTMQGLSYINNTRPDFGIISWIALEENKGSLPPYQRLAMTKPFPKGATTDQFAVVGCKDCEWPPENLIVYSSVPMSVAFLKSRLMPGVESNIILKTTNTMLMTLKKIASGENPDQVALLTPKEKHTLDNLKASWTENLTEFYKCRPIPTPVLVSFGEKPDISDDLVKVLVNMPNGGGDILESLHLMGFHPAN